ncbi:hypothetical protein GUJ93_ZPchr0001g29626 [Zizania palustris]|uniref:Uncharacterized protein n=1 Tax=Zizania palustris TaxID=103762 RepID=A0A8J5V2U7_ZIZPA|nr:hypothetical protein GUJ93_ZPchr0001g29626 [Zizania palustris]
MGEASSRRKDGREMAEAEAAKKVPLLGMFRYADRLDVLLMVVGTVGAVGNGMSEPLMTVFFGNVINSFGQNGSGTILRSVTKVSEGARVTDHGDVTTGSGSI